VTPVAFSVTLLELTFPQLSQSQTQGVASER